MAELSFPQMTDRTRLDRLQGEILAFVSDFEEQGYDNLEIARELVEAAFKRAWREPETYISASFFHHVRDVCSRYLASRRQLIVDLAEQHFERYY